MLCERLILAGAKISDSRPFATHFLDPDPEKNYSVCLPDDPGHTLRTATGGCMGPGTETVCVTGGKKN